MVAFLFDVDCTLKNPPLEKELERRLNNVGFLVFENRIVATDEKNGQCISLEQAEAMRVLLLSLASRIVHGSYLHFVVRQEFVWQHVHHVKWIFDGEKLVELHGKIVFTESPSKCPRCGSKFLNLSLSGWRCRVCDMWSEET